MTRLQKKPPELRARAPGFTLIEVMVTVAIVAILASLALPSYTDYVRRGHIPEATSNLSASNAKMEQWFQDAKSYPTQVHQCMRREHLEYQPEVLHAHLLAQLVHELHHHCHRHVHTWPASSTPSTRTARGLPPSPACPDGPQPRRVAGSQPGAGVADAHAAAFVGGVQLIELMVAITIPAILTLLAAPGSVRTGHATTACAAFGRVAALRSADGQAQPSAATPARDCSSSAHWTPVAR